MKNKLEIYFLKGQKLNRDIWFGISSEYTNGKLTLITLTDNQVLPTTSGHKRDLIITGVKSTIVAAAKKMVTSKSIDFKAFFNKEDSVTGLIRHEMHGDDYEIINRQDNVPYEAHEILFFREIINECMNCR